MMPWWVSYIGIPYRDESSGRDGCNCWGLVRLVWQEQLQHDLPELIVPIRTHEELDRFKGIKPWQPIDQPRPFALALYRLPEGLLHAGVVADAGNLLHSTNRADSRIESLRKYRSYLQGFYYPTQAL